MHIDNKKINEHRITALLNHSDIEEIIIKKIAEISNITLDRNSITEVIFNNTERNHRYEIEAKVILVKPLQND